MRYCSSCRRISEGWPTRCRFCGLTWGTRLCKRGHPNPINAVFCGECGSAEMSDASTGGQLVNGAFRLVSGDGGWIRVTFTLVIFGVLASVVISHLERFTAPLIAIVILTCLFRFMARQLPKWLFTPLARQFRKTRNQSKHRSRNRDSRVE